MRGMRGKRGLGNKRNGALASKTVFALYSSLSFPLLFLSLFLVACGFSPVYGSHSNHGSDTNPQVAAELNQVAINGIPDRNGQMLRNDLIDRMYGKAGRPGTPNYTLSVNLHYTVEDLGIQADATSTRSLMNMYGDYKLMDMQQHVLLSGTAHSVTSFNKLANEYGTLSAQDSAYERTIHEISEQLVNRLSLFLAQRPDPSTQPPLPPVPEPKTITIPNASQSGPQNGSQDELPPGTSSTTPTTTMGATTPSTTMAQPAPMPASPPLPVPPTQLPSDDASKMKSKLPVVSPASPQPSPNTVPASSMPTTTQTVPPSVTMPASPSPDSTSGTASPTPYPPVNFGVP